MQSACASVLDPEGRRSAFSRTMLLATPLRAAGASYASVVKTTVFLVSMGDYAAVNEVYGKCACLVTIIARSVGVPSLHVACISFARLSDAQLGS
jgi:enamine deaminase RidA (YjgF/YER057c/UK114 family)